MLRHIYCFLIATSICGSSAAITPSQIRWHDEKNDTTFITKLLTDVSGIRATRASELVIPIAKKLAGTPYGAGTIEHTPEMLTIRMDSMDCTTFVENVLAAAKATFAGRSSWQDFAQELMGLRYRNGTVNGYASRLHYISDWIVDNSHRGNIQDVTDRIGKPDYMVKTLDFMSHNRDKYPAMKDDKVYEDIKNTEIGYRSHRYPYIKPVNLKKVAFKEGDIVAFVTSIKGLDVTHVGFVTIVNGVPHLLHASSKGGKVMIDAKTLHDYLKRNRTAAGIRVIRLKD